MIVLIELVTLTIALCAEAILITTPIFYLISKIN